MASISREQVLDALRSVQDPGGDPVSRGLVSEIVIVGSDVMFSITVDPRRAQEMEPLRAAAQKAVAGIAGVGKVMVALTAERPQGQAQQRGQTQQRQSAPAPSPAQQTRRAVGGVPGVQRIIAVASGKGGVGKSTTAVNLALGLKALGLRIGVLDADIYGPSLPRLLGVTGRPRQVQPGSRMLTPLEGHGLKVMSMGFLVEEDTPVIWRGPMVMSALQQMMREVEWGELDLMVVDMPPGTGDAQLTLAQQTPLAGAVIVSTPQDLALIDARKGLAMFRKVDVPVLGIVENMSYFVCPSCGEAHDIFGHGGARAEAERLGVPFLGEVPLDIEIRERSDSGQPIVATQPESPHAAVYREIAGRVWSALQGEPRGMRTPPRIVIEQ
ncbi:MAG: Mrp/NBP35 family ATP-binding protein [Parvibaculaceae bacterium]